MQFSKLASILSLVAVGIAAPALEKRTGWGGEHGQQPPSSAPNCDQNSVAYCNAGGDDWFQWGDNSNKCQSGSVFCCSAGDESNNLGSCSNILSGNTVKVPISILGGGAVPSLKPRGQQWGNWGHSEPPAQAPTCNQNSVAYCNAGGDDWVHFGDNNNKCQSGSVFCCSAGDESSSTGSCSNILSGNEVKVPINLLGGLKLLKARGGQWGHSGDHSGNPSSQGQTCNQNSIAVCQAGGGDWIHAGDNNNNCQSGSTYCCSSGKESNNLLSCSNVLSGNSITIPITVLGGGGSGCSAGSCS